MGGVGIPQDSGGRIARLENCFAMYHQELQVHMYSKRIELYNHSRHLHSCRSIIVSTAA
jgi:hypothetical protein